MTDEATIEKQIEAYDSQIKISGDADTDQKKLVRWISIFGYVSPKDVFDELGKGFIDKSTLITLQPGKFTIQHFSPEGEISKTRPVLVDKSSIFMDGISLDGPQGKGRATQAFGNFVSLIRKHYPKMNHLVLRAGHVGSYTWLKFGFIPDKDSWLEMRYGDVDNVYNNDSLHARALKIRDQLRVKNSKLITVLNGLINTDDPRAAWDIADMDTIIISPKTHKEMKLGFYLLEGNEWDGALDLKDVLKKDAPIAKSEGKIYPHAMEKFDLYTTHLKLPQDLRKQYNIARERGFRDPYEAAIEAELEERKDQIHFTDGSSKETQYRQWKQEFGNITPNEVLRVLGEGFEHTDITFPSEDLIQHPKRNKEPIQCVQTDKQGNVLRTKYVGPYAKDNEILLKDCRIITGNTGSGLAIRALKNLVGLAKAHYPNIESFSTLAVTGGSYTWLQFGFLPEREAWELMQLPANEEKPLESLFTQRKKCIADQLHPKVSALLDIYIKSKDPHSAWDIANMDSIIVDPDSHQKRKLGEYMLSHNGWAGSLNLKDTISLPGSKYPAAMEKFDLYTSKLSVPPSFREKYSAANVSKWVPHDR